VVLAFPLLFWGLIAAYVHLFPDSNLVGTVGASIVLGGMILFGMVADRWWACALPILWAGIPIGVARIVDLIAGGCSVCTGDTEGWSAYSLLILIVAVIPVTLALAAGVGIRRGIERWALGWPGDRDARPPAAPTG
jgi:hypothetical protein